MFLSVKNGAPFQIVIFCRIVLCLSLIQINSVLHYSLQFKNCITTNLYILLLSSMFVVHVVTCNLDLSYIISHWRKKMLWTWTTSPYSSTPNVCLGIGCHPRIWINSIFVIKFSRVWFVIRDLYTTLNKQRICFFKILQSKSFELYFASVITVWI